MVTPIRVLIWADLLAVYAIWVLMTYLTDIWDLSITHAAGILNIWGGIVLILPIGLRYLVDTLLRDYSVLALSSIAYSIGLGFLSMSTPPVLHNATGTCSEYKRECIGHTQKGLFYTALPLIAIGMSGHIVTLKPFILEQNKLPNEQSMEKTALRPPRKRELLLALFALVGGLALPYINPWSIRFGIPAICTFLATITFLSGSCYYEKGPGPKGSPLTNTFRVIFASASNMCKQLPSNPKELHEEREPDRLPHTDGLRCLDKAAIKLPNAERNKWRVCTVTQVEETKICIRMIPMWLTFIICGLVSSAGSTYFQEQANNLDRHVGKLKVPLPILLLLQEFAKSIFSRIYTGLRGSFKDVDRGRYAPPVGIAAAMIFASLSCITSAKVEARRLDVVRSHGLIEKEKEIIPMNIFWVLPQFVLLAGVDAFFENGVKDFFSDQSPKSMAKYLEYFARGVSGLGFMASVLSAFVVGKISERGGRSNWFQHTINKSRLDNYFWTLSGLCAVNFAVFLVIACVFSYRQEDSDGEGQQGEGQFENGKFDGFDDTKC